MSVTALLRTLPGGHRGGSSQQLALWRNNGLARFLCRLRGAFPEGRETEREREGNCRPPAAREPEPKPALPDAAAREGAGLRAAVREGAGPEAVPGGAGPEVPGRREREVGTWPPQRSRRMAAALSAERLEVSVDGLTLSPNAEAPPCEARPGHGDSATGRNRAGLGCPSQAEAGGEEAAALSPERRWGFALEELYGLALRFFKGNSPGALEGRGGPRGARPENGAKNEKSASILACGGKTVETSGKRVCFDSRRVCALCRRGCGKGAPALLRAQSCVSARGSPARCAPQEAGGAPQRSAPSGGDRLCEEEMRLLQRSVVPQRLNLQPLHVRDARPC